MGDEKILFPTLPIHIMYAGNMCGIDTQDQVQALYSTELNMKKWWHRLFFFALDATFIISFLMYKHMCLDRGVKPMSHAAFQMEVCHSLMGIPLPANYSLNIELVQEGIQEEGTGSPPTPLKVVE